MTEPESTWRIRSGVGLLSAAPMSPERRALFDKEAERERKAAELEAEQRREAAAEHRGDLLMRGVEPHSVQEVLERASFGQDRADAVEARREREAAERFGKPTPHQTHALLAAAKAERKEREAEAESTPASKADVGGSRRRCRG